MSNFLLYYAMRYLPLVLSSSILNLTPIITAVLSWLILGECYKLTNILALSFGFIGILIMIAGQFAASSEEDSGKPIIDMQDISIIQKCLALLAILNVPVLSGLSSVNMRTAKDLNHYVMSFYMMLSSLLVFTCIIAFN